MKKGALFFFLIILLSFDVYATHVTLFNNENQWGQWIKLCSQNTYPLELGQPRLNYCANSNDYGCLGEHIRYYCRNYPDGIQEACSQQVYIKNIFVCPEQSCPADICDGFTFVDYQTSCTKSCRIGSTQNPDPSLNTACDSCSCSSNRQVEVGKCSVQCLSHANCAEGNFCQNYQCVQAGERPRCSDGTFDCYKDSISRSGCGQVQGCIDQPMRTTSGFFNTCAIKYNSAYEGSFLLNPADLILCSYDFIECGSGSYSFSKDKTYITDFTGYTCSPGSPSCSYDGGAFYQARYQAACTTCSDSDSSDGWNLNLLGTCTDSTGSYTDTVDKEYYCTGDTNKCAAAACPAGKRWDAATSACVNFFCSSHAECGSNLYCINTGGPHTCKTASEICSNGAKDTVPFTSPVFESDIDCGNSLCSPIGRKCANDKVCFSHDDCQSGACVSGRCSGDSPPTVSDAQPSGDVLPLKNSLRGYAYFDAKNNICAISGFVCDSSNYNTFIDVNLYRTSGHWLNSDFNYLYLGSATANSNNPLINTLTAANCGGTTNHAFSFPLSNPPSMSVGVFGVNQDNNLLLGYETTDSYNVGVIDYYCTNSFTAEPQVSQTYVFPFKKGYVPIIIRTNELASCRYYTTDASFSNMRYSFQQFENGFLHKASFQNFVAGTNTLYVRCKDGNGLETQSTIIQFNVNAAASLCANAIKDSGETGIDCGNTCVPLGRTCDYGSTCTTQSDCSSGFCSNGICRTCTSQFPNVACAQRLQLENEIRGISLFESNGDKKISLELQRLPADSVYQRYFAYVKGHILKADNSWQEFSYSFEPSIPTVDFFDNSGANAVWYDITGDGIAARGELSFQPSQLAAGSAGENSIVAFVCGCPVDRDCVVQSNWECNVNEQSERGIHKGKWLFGTVG